ncbi:MAG: HpcH/HpaI aldolase/citrate lyase family protein [Betaproteobacteria bacterium]|nr:HpcH/HpaI aldolase/citrate lyase family protein [Betaproteobacteria bacterium]
MDMPKNLFKQRLRQGRWQVGLFVGMTSAYSMEILAGAGFDWLVIDAEHSPNNPASVLSQLQAAAPYPAQLLVRPMNHDPALIKQYLDVGAQTLLLPLVDNAVQAQDLVRALRYPPDGIRGVAASLARAAHWNGVKDYVRQAKAETCLVVQVETRQGLENLDAIVAVDGVDGVFIGPADLAASLGHLGDAGHSEVRAAIEDALRRISATGKAAGVFVTDPALATHYRDCGASFIAVGGDTTLLRNAALKLAASFRDGSSGSGAVT